MQVGFAISPGPVDRLRLAPTTGPRSAAKVDQVVAVGVELVCLAARRHPGAARTAGTAHAELTTWLHDHLGGRAELILVPTEYAGTAPTPYLDALAAGVPADVPIAGPATVVCDEITVAEAGPGPAALGGRPPFVWDNYPVNDGRHGRPAVPRPAAGPRGRPGRRRARATSPTRWCSLGVEAAAGVDRGVVARRRPVSAWAAEAETLGWRVFAEACDGAVRRPWSSRRWTGSMTTPAGSGRRALASGCRRVRRAARPASRTRSARGSSRCTPRLGSGSAALRLVELARAQRFGEGDRAGLRPRRQWAPCAAPTGPSWEPRCGLRPMLGQRPDGTWSFRAASIIEDDNAIDALVRAASRTSSPSGPLRAQGRRRRSRGCARGGLPSVSSASGSRSSRPSRNGRSLK